MADDGLHRRVGMWRENIKTVTGSQRGSSEKLNLTSPLKVFTKQNSNTSSACKEFISCAMESWGLMIFDSFSLSFASLGPRDFEWTAFGGAVGTVDTSYLAGFCGSAKLGGLRMCQEFQHPNLCWEVDVTWMWGMERQNRKSWKSFNHHFPDLKDCSLFASCPWHPWLRKCGTKQQPCSWCALSWGAPHVNHLQVPAEPHFPGSIEEPWHKRDVVAICCNLVSSQPKCFCKWHVCSDVA